MKFCDEFPWEDFDSQWYAQRYFGKVREDDLEILHSLQATFAKAELPRSAAGLDVGPGPNLYPSLVMLPFCDTITLWEYASPNVRWLEREVPSYSSLWDPFWDELADHPPYSSVHDPRNTLAAKAIIRRGSVVDLPERQWDIGSMLFVAESLSTSRDDFQVAILGFILALKQGAPFVIGFMEYSQGYPVGRHKFPAVSVGAEDVCAILEPVTGRLQLLHVGTTSRPIRAGYRGMILATGRAGAPARTTTDDVKSSCGSARVSREAIL